VLRLRLEQVKGLVCGDDRKAAGRGGPGRQMRWAIEGPAREGHLRLFAAVKAARTINRRVHEHDWARRCVNREGYPGLQSRGQKIVATNRASARASRQQDANEAAKRDTHRCMTAETEKGSTPSRDRARGRGTPGCLILKTNGVVDRSSARPAGCAQLLDALSRAGSHPMDRLECPLPLLFLQLHLV